MSRLLFATMSMFAVCDFVKVSVDNYVKVSVSRPRFCKTRQKNQISTYLVFGIYYSPAGDCLYIICVHTVRCVFAKRFKYFFTAKARLFFKHCLCFLTQYNMLNRIGPNFFQNMGPLLFMGPSDCRGTYRGITSLIMLGF